MTLPPMVTPQPADRPIFVKWTEFHAWLLPTTEKFPKKSPRPIEATQRRLAEDQQRLQHH